MNPPNTSYPSVYRLVAKIPKGKVTTYGRIASYLDLAGGARSVGWALAALPAGSGLPWHRVVNAQGKISLGESQSRSLQKALLLSEGVKFESNGRISLRKFLWDATDRADDSDVGQSS